MSVYISMAAFKHLIASFGSIKRRGRNSDTSIREGYFVKTSHGISLKIRKLKHFPRTLISLTLPNTALGDTTKPQESSLFVSTNRTHQLATLPLKPMNMSLLGHVLNEAT